MLLHVRKCHPFTYNAIILNITHNIFKGKYKTLKICVHSCPPFVLVMDFCKISADKYERTINAYVLDIHVRLCTMKAPSSGISDLSRCSLSCVGPLGFLTLRTYLSSTILDQGYSRKASCALN